MYDFFSLSISFRATTRSENRSSSGSTLYLTASINHSRCKSRSFSGFSLARAAKAAIASDRLPVAVNASARPRSGVIEVTDAVQGASWYDSGRRYFLGTNQAHYRHPTTSLVEGGQPRQGVGVGPVQRGVPEPESVRWSRGELMLRLIHQVITKEAPRKSARNSVHRKAQRETSAPAATQRPAPAVADPYAAARSACPGSAGPRPAGH